MFQLILGNTIALIASILMVISGIVKDRKKIIYIQSLQIIAFAISDFILGGYTGTVINLLSLVRNILSYNDQLNTPWKLVIIAFSINLSIHFNNLSFIGMLPLISSVTYTIFMNVKDTIKLKLLITFTMVLWLIYDICIKSYTSATFDFFSAIANIVTMYQLYKSKKKI